LISDRDGRDRRTTVDVCIAYVELRCSKSVVEDASFSKNLPVVGMGHGACEVTSFAKVDCKVVSFDIEDIPISLQETFSMSLSDKVFTRSRSRRKRSI